MQKVKENKRTGISFEKVRNIDRSPKSLKISPASADFNQFAKECDRAKKRNAWILKNEKRQFGGNPLPWDERSKEYFNKIF